MEKQEVCEEISELRMIKLLPHGISDNWPELRHGIEASLPKFSETSVQQPDRMTRILEGLLAGELEIHVLYKLIQGRPFSYGFVMIGIVDSVDGTHKDLLIHTYYGHRKMLSSGDFVHGIDILREYAKFKGCVNVVTYARREFYQNYLASIGFNTDFIYAVLEV